jgi:nitrate reductase NapAB chaperone NapD
MTPSRSTPVFSDSGCVDTGIFVARPCLLSTGKYARFQKETSMPVFSYLAYPKEGRKTELINDLAVISHCEIMPSENQDILILVTDTPDAAKEKELQENLKKLKSLESLGMTFGHTDG